MSPQVFHAPLDVADFQHGQLTEFHAQDGVAEDKITCAPCYHETE
jgi:hypothetical protein